MPPGNRRWYSRTLLLAAIGSVLSFVPAGLYPLVFILGNFISAPRRLSVSSLAALCFSPLASAVNAAFLVMLCAEVRGRAPAAKRQRVAQLGVVLAGIAALLGSWRMYLAAEGLAHMGSMSYRAPTLTSLLIPTLHPLAWMGLLVMFAGYSDPLGSRVTRWLAATLAVLTAFRSVSAARSFLYVSSRGFSVPIPRPAFVGPLPTLPPAVITAIQVFASLSLLAFCIAVWGISGTRETYEANPSVES